MFIGSLMRMFSDSYCTRPASTPTRSTSKVIIFAPHRRRVGPDRGAGAGPPSPRLSRPVVGRQTRFAGAPLRHLVPPYGADPPRNPWTGNGTSSDRLAGAGGRNQAPKIHRPVLTCRATGKADPLAHDMGSAAARRTRCEPNPTAATSPFIDSRSASELMRRSTAVEPIPGRRPPLWSP